MPCETNPLGETTSYTYDANGSVVEETTAYVYDANNRVVETRYPDGSTTATEYDVAGNQVASIDALGRRTEYRYDAYGRLTDTYHPDGTAEYKTYDGEGNLLTETDPQGRLTRYTYDGLNRVIRTDYPDGSHTSTVYDAAGRVTGETDANGNTTTYEYDAAGRRTAVVDALGNRHSYAYDADGNLVSETDANGHTTEYTYNTLDQRTQTRYHDGTTVTETFDALGRRTARTDQNGRSTEYEYDALGRLTKVTDALDGVTTYTYDEAGNKLTQTDAEGRTTRWTYDSQGRVLSRTLPLGQTESFTYDAAGNRLSHTDFKGQTTRYRYDLSQRLTQVIYGDGTTESFTYEAVGNRRTATTPEGTTRYRYDAQNRLVEEIQPDGSVLTYGYDAAGNRTQLDVSAGSGTTTTRYRFDALNRLEVVEDSQGRTLYTYDAVGNRESVSYPSGNVTLYDYDALNRLTRLTTTDAADQIVADYLYTLDDTGRRTQVVENHNGRTTAYRYGELYRLTGETITDPVNGNYSAEYQFDKVGNRIYSIINGVHTAYSVDNNDRLTQQGGTTYAYDANGNTLTETENGQVTRYRYDARNKFIEVEKPGLTARYGYNADGIRTRKTENGITTHYVVDSNRDYAQVLAEISNGSTDVSYTYGDDLISQQRAGQAYYYLYDGHGSTRALADGAGSLTDGYDYDAFGVLLNSVGDTENDYLYTGEQLDQNLDQYYLRARYYDQGVGRFTQMDDFSGFIPNPITIHKYLYGNSEPVNNLDPSGNISLSSIGSAMNIGARLASRSVANVGRSALNSLNRSLSKIGTRAKNGVKPKKKVSKKGRNKDEEPDNFQQYMVMLEARMGAGYFIQPKPGKTLMNLSLLAAKYYFGHPDKSELIKIAENIVVEYPESDVAWEIAYSFENIVDLKEIIIELYKEMQLHLPTHYEAGMALAKHYSNMVLSDQCSAYEGAKMIWNHIVNNEEIEGEFENLNWIVGLASEYEDFFEAGQQEFYGKEECKQLQLKTNQKILDEMKLLFKYEEGQPS